MTMTSAPPGAPSGPSGPPATPPPDLPKVPRAKLATSAVVLAVLGSFVVGGYAWAAFTNYEPGSPARDEIPASVRSAQGGYRQFHFWHSGYHGGK